MFKLSQETIAIVTVGLALAGLDVHGRIEARDREAIRAEARTEREAIRADGRADRSQAPRVRMLPGTR